MGLFTHSRSPSVAVARSRKDANRRVWKESCSFDFLERAVAAFPDREYDTVMQDRQPGVRATDPGAQEAAVGKDAPTTTAEERAAEEKNKEQKVQEVRAMRQRLEQLGMLDPSAAAFPRRSQTFGKAEQAVKQSLLLLRDVRLFSSGSDRRASLILIDKLPELLSILIDDFSFERRAVALEKISDVVARIDPLDEKQLQNELDKLGLIVAVVMCLEATPVTEDKVLAPGLVLLANVALIADGATPIIESGGVALLCRLLCGFDGRRPSAMSAQDASPLPSIAIQRFAAGALYGVTRTQRGREAVPLSVRAKLMESLKALASSDAAAYRHAHGTLLNLRRLRRSRAKVGSSAARDALESVIEEERRNKTNALTKARLAKGVVENRAACRLQAAYRLRRDARRGAEALTAQKNALAFIAMKVNKLGGGSSLTRIGRQQLAAKFGGRLRVRAQANLQQRLAQRSADLPSEEAELLLNLFEEEGLVDAEESEMLSDAERRRRQRQEQRARRMASLRACAVGCVRTLVCARFFEWLHALIRRFCRAAVRADTYFPEAVIFTVKWTYEHHRIPFLRALVLITYSSIYMGAIPVMMNYLFNVALPNAQRGDDCALDTGLMVALIIFGYASVVQVKYILSISKMDGAGFVPAFQRQMAMHLCRVDQANRDTFNETELITVIEKDTSTLNKVILAVFGMLGNIIELAILLPSLSFLSVELSIIVIVAIPTFLWLQLRQGNYIVAAAKALRGAEFVFMRAIEESLMFTVSRKVLGIGYELDKTMRSAEKNLVKKFEVLDRREASSTRQLTFFNHMLRGIVLLVGVILMQIELQDDESPWNLKTPGTCLMDGSGGGGGGRSLGADTDAAGVVQRRYRLTLGTLFAFVSSISSVQSLCLEMISCIRRFQVGKPAVKRVKGYLAAPEDPWAEHAQSLKLSDVKQKLKVKLSAAARLSSAWRDARYGGRTMTCTIVNTDRRRRIGLVLNDECVVIDVLRTGLAYEQDAVRVGDRLLSINGSRLSYGAKQAIMMLNRLGRLDITLVRQNENGSGMLPRRSCKALATGAFTSPGMPIRMDEQNDGGGRGGDEQLARWDDARIVSAAKAPGEKVGFFLSTVNDSLGRRVVVDNVLPSSLFAGLLRRGDELLEVNGWPVGPKDTKEAKRRCLTYGGQLRLVVRTTGLMRLQPAAGATDAVVPGSKPIPLEFLKSVLDNDSKPKATARAPAAAQGGKSQKPNAGMVAKKAAKGGAAKTSATAAAGPAGAKRAAGLGGLLSRFSRPARTQPISGKAGAPAAAPAPSATSDSLGPDLIPTPKPALSPAEENEKRLAMWEAASKREQNERLRRPAPCLMSPHSAYAVSGESAAWGGAGGGGYGVVPGGGGCGRRMSTGPAVNAPPRLAWAGSNVQPPPSRGMGEPQSLPASAVIRDSVIGVCEAGGRVVQFTMPFRMSIGDVAAVLRVSVDDLISWNSKRFATLTATSVLSQNSVVHYHQPRSACSASSALPPPASASFARPLATPVQKFDASPPPSPPDLQRHSTSLAAEASENDRAKLKRKASFWAKADQSTRAVPAISVSNVEFKHKSKVVLKEFNLEVPAGAKMLLLGRSGCGKSTILQLIARLYQPCEGGLIEINGENINNLVLHEHLLMVEQAPVVFAGTYRENLKIVKQEATDEELQEACIKASTWNDVQDLGGGKGLDADVGFRGKLLSGGEKQRLCLARALLQKRPILLLDEPVSAQDIGSIQAITSMLATETVPKVGGEKGASTKLTVLATTHNLSMLDQFTHVAYISNGRVVEGGEKDDVLARKGYVHRRLVSQSGLFVDKRGRATVQPTRLRQVWLFSNAPEQSLTKIIGRMSTRNLNAGEELFKEGNDADSMFLVVEGQVEMRIQRAGEGTDGESTEGSTRTVWQAGDEIGVGAVVDSTMLWPGTAVVASLKAVLLELSQSDLEAFLEPGDSYDPGLSESVGKLIEDLKIARSPQRLQLLWNFFGANVTALEAVGTALEPTVYDEGAVLCDAPRDPCATMSFVVQGSVDALQGESTGEESAMVERLGANAVIGMAEVLPAPEPGSMHAAICSRQGMLRKVRTNEYTIMLELQREQLASLMLRQPALAETYAANLQKWMSAVSPNALRSRSWVFSALPIECTALLAPLWTISVEKEGNILIDGEVREDRCVVVLEGEVELRTRRGIVDGGRKHSTSHGPGAVLNEIGLIAAPAEGMNGDADTLVSAEVTTTALVLTLTRASFIGALNRFVTPSADAGNGLVGPEEAIKPKRKKGKRGAAVMAAASAAKGLGGVAGSALVELRRLARARAELQTSSGVERARLLPSGLNAEKMLSCQVATRVLHKPGASLFECDASATVSRDRIIHHEHMPKQATMTLARTAGGKGVVKQGIKDGSSSAEPAKAKVAASDARPLSKETQAALRMVDWGLAQKVFALLRGQLRVELLDGREVTLRAGDFFCTPLSEFMGDVDPERVWMAVVARHAKAEPAQGGGNQGAGKGGDPAVVLEWDLTELTEEFAESRRAAEAEKQRLEEEREELKARLRNLEKREIEMEVRLGHREQKEARELWLWAYRRIRAYSAFGVVPSDRPDTRSAGSLEEQMAVVQGRILHYEKLIGDRTKQLKELERAWRELQPPVFPGESSLVIDTETFDLSLTRLEEASSCVDRLTSMRKERRDTLLAELERLWGRAGLDPNHREVLRSGATANLGQKAIGMLLDALATQRALLEPTMRKVQAQLQEQWETLALPMEMRVPFMWKKGDGDLTEGLVVKCEEELATLADLSSRLRPLLNGANKPVLGMAVALMHGALARKAPSPADGADGADGAAAPGAAPGSALVTAAEQLAMQQTAAANEMAELRAQARAEGHARVEALSMSAEKDRRLAELEAKLGSLEANTKLKTALHHFEMERQQREKLERASRAPVMAATPGGNMAEAHAQPVEEVLVSPLAGRDLKAEQRERTAKYAQLCNERQTRIRHSQNCLKMLRATPADLADFARCFPDSVLVDPRNASEEDVEYLEEEVKEIAENDQRLQTRCESDGLLVAIRSLCADRGWSIRAMAMQVLTEQPCEDDGATSFQLKQLQNWLSRMKLQYTSSGMAFLLFHCGTSMKAMLQGELLPVDRFASSFDRVESSPLVAF